MADISEGDVRQVWLDGLRRPLLDRSVAQIGAPAAWQAGLTGERVKVAVLDTGVDATHPDLAEREIAEKNFTEEPDALDTVGHGTHVTATIAGNGPLYKGVALDARLLDGKVCTTGGCAESWILAGMQWAVDQDADVVNMSLGGADSPGVDPLEEAVNRLSRQSGTLFVVAACNEGRSETIGSPGSAELALTVGSVDRDDTIAFVSSRGPSYGDGAIKPNSPHPVSASWPPRRRTPASVTRSAPTTWPCPKHRWRPPHVAGAVALLERQHPDWTRARLKATLMASAKPNPALMPFDQGAGRVDVAKALSQALVADPGTLNLGTQQWPHYDDPKVTRDITYRNSGSSAITLDLSADVRGPDGTPAPAGLLSVSPTRLAVPAGGEATATVTSDPTTSDPTTYAPDGAYVGSIVAGPLRTSINVTREVESYDVMLKHLDAVGNLAARYSSRLVDVVTGRAPGSYAGESTATRRLPKGEYFVVSSIWTGEKNMALLSQPKLVVSSKIDVTLDARQAKPVDVAVFDSAARGVVGSIWFNRTVNGVPLNNQWLFFELFTDDRVSIATLGEQPPDHTTSVTSQFVGAPRDDRTPVTYRLAWYEQDRATTGFVRAVKSTELAEMRTGFVAGTRVGEHVYQIGLDAVGPDGRGSLAWLTAVPEGGRSVDLVLAEGPR